MSDDDNTNKKEENESPGELLNIPGCLPCLLKQFDEFDLSLFQALLTFIHFIQMSALILDIDKFPSFVGIIFTILAPIDDGSVLFENNEFDPRFWLVFLSAILPNIALFICLFFRYQSYMIVWRYLVGLFYIIILSIPIFVISFVIFYRFNILCAILIGIFVLGIALLIWRYHQDFTSFQGILSILQSMFNIFDEKIINKSDYTEEIETQQLDNLKNDSEKDQFIHPKDYLEKLRKYKLSKTSDKDSDEFVIQFLKEVIYIDYSSKEPVERFTGYFDNPGSMVPGIVERDKPKCGDFSPDVYFQFAVTYKFLEIKYPDTFKGSSFKEGKKFLKEKCNKCFQSAFNVYQDKEYHNFKWHFVFVVLHILFIMGLIILFIFQKLSILLFSFAIAFFVFGLIVHLKWCFVMKEDSTFKNYLNFVEYSIQPFIDGLFLTFLDFLLIPVTQMCMKLLLFSKTKCENNEYYSINQSIDSIFDFMFLQQSECIPCGINTPSCNQACNGHSFYSLKEYEGMNYSTDVICTSIFNWLFALVFIFGFVYSIFRLNRINIKLIESVPVPGRNANQKWYNLLGCIQSKFLGFLGDFKFDYYRFYFYQTVLRFIFSIVASFSPLDQEITDIINLAVNIVQLVILLLLRPYRSLWNFVFETLSCLFTSFFLGYSLYLINHEHKSYMTKILLCVLFAPVLIAFILKIICTKQIESSANEEIIVTTSVCYLCKYIDKKKDKNFDDPSCIYICSCKRGLALHDFPDFKQYHVDNSELPSFDFCSIDLFKAYEKCQKCPTQKTDSTPNELNKLYLFIERFINSKSILEIFKFLRSVTLLGIFVSSWYFGAIYGTHKQRLDLKC